MGVVYKLKPEIKNFILKKKQVDPRLSCRGLAGLIEEKFKITVSKSSINSLIKQSGLSMPVGRRRKRRRAKLEAEGLGAILLKAADYTLKGSHLIVEAIQKHLNYFDKDRLAKTEYLIYNQLFGATTTAPLSPDCAIWTLINQRFTPETISSYLNELQEVKTLNLDIVRAISAASQEVRCVRVTLFDGTTFYLDGQLYTVWSTPQIPYDFSTPIYNIKSYITRYFQEDKPFVLFNAPGYDTPSKEFFDFMLGLDSAEKGVSKITLYGNKFEELETIKLDQRKKFSFVFGLWPWQFGQFRRVIIKGEFKPIYFEALSKGLYMANIEIELSQPASNKRVTLRGCALKTNLNEKIRLIILSNIPAEGLNLEDLANFYLSHWPNIEEAFQDFSRKIELFTYTASSHRFFSLEAINFPTEAGSDLNTLFSTYLKALDLYVKWHFLPFGYEEKDFSTVKAQFYDLKAVIKKQKDRYIVTFKPPSEYPFLKDLDYACRRVNEREVMFPDGKRLWLAV